MKTHTAWEIRFNEPDGTTQYVLATDYAALEAERDELKRRLATIIHEMSNLALRNKRDKLIVAIAEGRDND